MTSPRQRFLSYVRNPCTYPRIVSPFLPHPTVVQATLRMLGLPIVNDDVADEITLSENLGYEPMFMTECSGLIFAWQIDESRSTATQATRVIHTRKGEWVRISPRIDLPWSDVSACPVQTPHDHEMLVAVCEEVGERGPTIREYFRGWRQRVGEQGVIVLGHPHPAWLGFQISPSNIFYQWNDYRAEYRRSMQALYHASLFVMSLALEEGIDFMSDSSYGLEMTSPALFAAMDLPYIQAFADWTRKRNGLFWYHNCGFSSKLIKDGIFNTLGAHVIETIAPPPEGDNDLTESRQAIDRGICTKGNLNLNILRDCSPDQIASEVQEIVCAVRGYPHIVSTADAVLPGTPPENFVTFVQAAQKEK
jgi:Uroporphyrinogen decarboxylase (URO-D)